MCATAAKVPLMMTSGEREREREGGRERERVSECVCVCVCVCMRPRMRLRRSCAVCLVSPRTQTPKRTHSILREHILY